MKTKLFFFLAFTLCWSPIEACSVVCGIPSVFDTVSFLMKGKVVGYALHVVGDQQEAFGSIEVEVTKTYYAAENASKVHLFKLGLSADCRSTGFSVDYLKNLYPIGSALTFHGIRTDRVKGEEVYIDIPVCSVLMKGTRWMKSPYDYQKMEKQQHATNYARLQLQRQKPTLSTEEYREIDQQLDEKAVRYYKKQDRILPERLQAQFDLLKIKQAKSEAKRYRILSKMIWSKSLRKDFIDTQAISEKKKARLKKKREQALQSMLLR